MMADIRLASVAILAVGALALACAEEPSPAASSKSGDSRPRLVLLYATCSLNKSFLSLYRPEIAFTPNLETFARSATVFDRHRAEAGLSGVAYASIFSGRDTFGHGVFTHPSRLTDSAYLITEAFADAGYDVFAWLGHPMADVELNYAQGVPAENAFNDGLTPESASFPRFRELLDRLAADPAYKAFVVTNFTVTHGPYRDNYLDAFCEEFPDECASVADLSRRDRRTYSRMNRDHHEELAFNHPETVRRLRLEPQRLDAFARWMEVLYKSNVRRLDSLFGQTLDEIRSRGLFDDSLIAFTADHGETLYDENAPFKWSHSHSLRADVLDAPLIVHSPGVEARRFDSVTRGIDIYPTMAALAGLSLPGDSADAGRDLSAALPRDAPVPSFQAFSHGGVLPAYVVAQPIAFNARLRNYHPESDVATTWVAVRREDFVWKYSNLDAAGFAHRKFNLSDDPSEREDLFDPDDPLDRAMAGKLEAYKSDLMAAFEIWRAIDATGGVADADQLKRLRALGYIK